MTSIIFVTLCSLDQTFIRRKDLITFSLSSKHTEAHNFISVSNYLSSLKISSSNFCLAGCDVLIRGYIRGLITGASFKAPFNLIRSLYPYNKQG